MDRKALFLSAAVLCALLFSCFFPSGEAFANYRITIEVVDLEVTNDWADWTSDADVYVEFWVKRPQANYHDNTVVGFHQTSTLYNQNIGTHPHAGYSFTVSHFDPLQVDFWVYDEDTGFDDLMAIGILPIYASPGSSYNKTVVGAYATITIKVTIGPAVCGSITTYTSHSPALVSWPPSGPVEMDLMLHVQEDEPTDWLVMREYLPASLAFVFADPMPDAIEELTLDGEPNGQLLTWKLEAPSGGEHFFHLVLEPVGPEEEFWGSVLRNELEWLETDGDLVTQYGGADGFNENVIGGNDDCDGNGIFDRKEIALDPGLDADGNHRLDLCEGSNIWTPDLAAATGSVLVVPVTWDQVQPGLDIRDFSFFVGFETGAMEFLGPQTGGTLLGNATWQADWFMASDTHMVVHAYGETPLIFSSGLPLIELPFFVNAPLVQQPPVRIFDFVYNGLSTWTVPVSNGAVISSLKEQEDVAGALKWEVYPSGGSIQAFLDLPAPAGISLLLWDMTGRPLGQLITAQGVPGRNELTAPLPGNLPAGMYLVELRVGERGFFEKVFLN